LSQIDNHLSARLGKLIPRLASDADGEVIATVRAIQAALVAKGLDLHDLAAALQGREIVATTKAPQIAPAPTWNDLSHHERGAWVVAALAHPETTPFEHDRLSSLGSELNRGLWFTPHWRYRRLFEETVARLYAKGVRP
jgi:hypothetical protein